MRWNNTLSPTHAAPTPRIVVPWLPFDGEPPRECACSRCQGATATEMAEAEQEGPAARAPGVGATIYLPTALGAPGVKNETAIYVPSGYRPGSSVDVIVYLHGFTPHRTVLAYLTDKENTLREVLERSGRSAVLAVPMIGPRSQPGSLTRPGGFSAWMGRVLAALGGHLGRSSLQLGRLILAAHSGGGHPLSEIVMRTRDHADKLREVWMFDAVYSHVQNWQRFFAAGGPVVGRFAYTSHQRARNVSIKAAAAPNPRLEVRPTTARGPRSHHLVPQVEMPVFLDQSPLGRRARGSSPATPVKPPSASAASDRESFGGYATADEMVAEAPQLPSGVNTVLPRSGPGFYSYHPGSPQRQYGTAETIRALQTIGARWLAAHPAGPRIGVGDISFRGGGRMPPHASHARGVDVDLRIMRGDGKEEGATFRDAAYSRSLTQQLVDTIRGNGVLPVHMILFNDPAVTGVKPWKGHDNHLHVRFEATGASGRSPARATAPAPPTTSSGVVRAASPDVRAALQRWKLPTGLPETPRFHQLVDRWRPSHLPLALLVAFSALEASGWGDATHGTEKNRWTKPPFYELGVFQVPAGLHGACTSGRHTDCAHKPPGAPQHKSPWFKLCLRLGLDPLKWEDPTTQVRVGVANLEADAATVRRLFPGLFPNKGSGWALRASVLLPFGPGIGYTLKLLKKHAAALARLPESARWSFLQREGATTANVDKKMALAHKLALALGLPTSGLDGA